MIRLAGEGYRARCNENNATGGGGLVMAKEIVVVLYCQRTLRVYRMTFQTTQILFDYLYSGFDLPSARQLVALRVVQNGRAAGHKNDTHMCLPDR